MLVISLLVLFFGFCSSESGFIRIQRKNPNVVLVAPGRIRLRSEPRQIAIKRIVGPENIGLPERGILLRGPPELAGFGMPIRNGPFIPESMLPLPGPIFPPPSGPSIEDLLMMGLVPRVRIVYPRDQSSLSQGEDIGYENRETPIGTKTRDRNNRKGNRENARPNLDSVNSNGEEHLINDQTNQNDKGKYSDDENFDLKHQRHRDRADNERLKQRTRNNSYLKSPSKKQAEALSRHPDFDHRRPEVTDLYNGDRRENYNRNSYDNERNQPQILRPDELASNNQYLSLIRESPNGYNEDSRYEAAFEEDSRHPYVGEEYSVHEPYIDTVRYEHYDDSHPPVKYPRKTTVNKEHVRAYDKGEVGPTNVHELRYKNNMDSNSRNKPSIHRSTRNDNRNNDGRNGYNENYNPEGDETVRTRSRNRPNNRQTEQKETRSSLRRRPNINTNRYFEENTNDQFRVTDNEQMEASNNRQQILQEDRQPEYNYEHDRTHNDMPDLNNKKPSHDTSSGISRPNYNEPQRNINDNSDKNKDDLARPINNVGTRPQNANIDSGSGNGSKNAPQKSSDAIPAEGNYEEPHAATNSEYLSEPDTTEASRSFDSSPELHITNGDNESSDASSNSGMLGQNAPTVNDADRTDMIPEPTKRADLDRPFVEQQETEVREIFTEDTNSSPRLDSSKLKNYKAIERPQNRAAPSEKNIEELPELRKIQEKNIEEPPELRKIQEPEGNEGLAAQEEKIPEKMIQQNN